MNSRSRARIVLLTVMAFALIPAIAYLWGRAFRPNDRFQVTGNSMWPTLHHGDLCRVGPLAGRPVVGDLVAIRWEGKRRVKRIAAIGGQTVAVEAGRLIVDGKRLEDHLAEKSEINLPPARIPVESTPESWSLSDDGLWLVYRHQNQHAGDRPTAIMDDYPINQDVARQLNPVDHLILEFTGASSFLESDATVEFYVDGAVRRGRFRDRIARSRDAELTDASPLTDERPIRIQWLEGLDKKALSIYREVEYRVDGPTAFKGYPCLLAEDQVFLVGDNVPVSVDSRSFGQISLDNVIGIVEKVTNPSSPDHP